MSYDPRGLPHPTHEFVRYSFSGVFAMTNDLVSQIHMTHFFRAEHQLNCLQCRDNDELSQAASFWRSRYRETGLNSPSENFGSPAQRYVFAVMHEIVCVGQRAQPARVLSRRVCGTATLTMPNADSAIGTVTRLAIDNSRLMANLFGKVAVFSRLTSCLHAFSLSQRLTHLEAIVHPRHARLYRRAFGAEPIGEPFECPEVGAEAQRMRAQIERPQAYHQRLRDHYLAKFAFARVENISQHHFA